MPITVPQLFAVWFDRDTTKRQLTDPGFRLHARRGSRAGRSPSALVVVALLRAQPRSADCAAGRARHSRAMHQRLALRRLRLLLLTSAVAAGAAGVASPTSATERAKGKATLERETPVAGRSSRIGQQPSKLKAFVDHALAQYIKALIVRRSADAPPGGETCASNSGVNRAASLRRTLRARQS